MGHEAADAYTRKAAAKGTMLHDFCESYLKHESPVLGAVEKYRYSGIIPHLNRIDPLYIEHQMWSKKLRVAGTADVIGKYDGTLSLIDFKSTSREKYDGEFDSYWMQTACYAVMAYERLGLFIPDLVIIMQDLSSGDCNVYKQKADKWIPRFKELRDAYKDQLPLLPEEEGR